MDRTDRDYKPEEVAALVLAELHWKWVSTWLEMVYIDAFAHGYKHGMKDRK